MSSQHSDCIKSESVLLQQLDTMVSEGRNPDTMDIDLLNTRAFCRR